MKDLSKTLVVKELINSLELLRKNLVLLLVASIIDAFFFVAWGFFTGPVKDKIVEHAVLITNQLSTTMAGQQVQKGILNYMIEPALRPLTTKLVLLIIILFIVMYIVYTVFHGTTWWLATKIAGKKWTYHKYFTGFAKINLLWMACYASYKLLDIIISIRYKILQKIVPDTPDIGGTILFIILLLLFVTAFLSYPLLKVKTIFITPLKTTIPLIVISASIYLTTQFILNNIGKINVNAAMAVGLILLFPVINLIRTYNIRVLSNVHTRP